MIVLVHTPIDIRSITTLDVGSVFIEFGKILTIGNLIPTHITAVHILSIKNISQVFCGQKMKGHLGIVAALPFW